MLPTRKGSIVLSCASNVPWAPASSSSQYFRTWAWPHSSYRSLVFVAVMMKSVCDSPSGWEGGTLIVAFKVTESWGIPFKTRQRISFACSRECQQRLPLFSLPISRQDCHPLQALMERTGVCNTAHTNAFQASVRIAKLDRCCRVPDAPDIDTFRLTRLDAKLDPCSLLVDVPRPIPQPPPSLSEYLRPCQSQNPPPLPPVDR